MQPADEATGLRQTLDDLLAAAGEARASAAERRDLAERALVTRARLLELLPDDERVPAWLIDQADGTIDLAIDDGSDLSVAFGLPTERQRERVAEAASEAMRLLGRARTAAERVSQLLEERLFADEIRAAPPETARRRAESIDAALSQLLDVDVAVRIPYTESRALTLLALVAEPPDQGASQAREALARLEPLSLITAQGAARRDVLIGMAALALARAEPDDGAHAVEAHLAFDRALERLDGAGADVSDRRTRTSARIGRYRAVGATVPPVSSESLRADADALLAESGRGADDDPFGALLAAEAVARTLLTRRRDDARWIDDAVAPLLGAPDLLETPSDAEALRAVVRAKIATVLSPGMPFESMHPEIALAQAQVTPDRAAREPLLRLVIDRAEPPLADEGRWLLAASLGESDRLADLLVTLDLLTVLARPESARRDRAIDAGVRLARFLRERTGATEAASFVRDASIRILRIAVTDESRTTEHDADRVELAALLFESADAVAHSEFILSLLIEVPAGSAHRGTADLLARAQLARLAGRHDLPPSLTGRIVSWANQVEDADSALHWLIDAEARLAVQDASVVGTLRVLANRSDWPAPVTADLVRLDLARALRLAGDVEESFAQFTRVADANDQPAFGEPRPPLFWGAWTEMLEILADDAAAGDDDGARAGRILLHLRRLALLDPELGGPSYRPRLEAVREGLER